MLNIFKEKQVQIRLMDGVIAAIGLLFIFLHAPGAIFNSTKLPVYIVLTAGILALAVLNHFAHNLLGKRVFLYGLNFIPLLVILYTSTITLPTLAIYFGCCLLADYIYKKFIETK